MRNEKPAFNLQKAWSSGTGVAPQATLPVLCQRRGEKGLHSLTGWGHGRTEQVLPGGQGPCGTDGPEQQTKHETQWAAITSIAEKFGCSAETLRNWVRQAERDQDRRPGLTTKAGQLQIHGCSVSVDHVRMEHRDGGGKGSIDDQLRDRHLPCLVVAMVDGHRALVDGAFIGAVTACRTQRIRAR